MSKRITLTNHDQELIKAMIDAAWSMANVGTGKTPTNIASKERLNQLSIKIGFRPLDPKTNQYVSKS